MIEILRLEVTNSIEISKEKVSIFRAFAQGMLNRLCVGELRYGPAQKKQKYLTRMIKELKAYRRDGNAEQLINIANYCVLEWIAPEHPKHYFDPTAESVTRKDAIR
jgi:hypothetical protein